MKKRSKILSGLLSLMLVLPTITLPVHAEDVSYADSAKPELPVNMITVDAGCSDWDAYNNGKAVRLGWNFHFTATTDGAYNSVSYKITADTRYNAEPSHKVGPIGKTLDHMSGDFEAGKSYIVSAWAKDISAEGVEPLEFGIEMEDNYGNQTEITPITLTKEWQQYTKVFHIYEGYPGLRYLKFGVPTTHTNLDGQGFMLDDISVVEEITYDIAFEGGDVVVAGGSTTVDANALNQLGSKGWLPQEFTWVATDTARTAPISGITVTPNEEDSSVATISVDNTVKSGTYSIVATANGFTKGYDIKVKNLNDANAQKPANMIKVDAGCSDWDAYNTGKVSRLSWNFNHTATTEGAYNSVSYKLTADTRYNAEPVYKVNPLGKTLSHMSGDFEAGKDYIISAWVKDVSAEGVAPIEFATAIMDAGWTNIWSGSKITLTDEWQQYADIFTAPANYTSLKNIQFGVPSENATLAGQGFMLDDLYVAEEVPCKINLTADEKLIKGNTLNANVEILNQLGQKGKLSQDCDWYVTDLERENVLDDFNIEKTATGVSVTLKDSAETGRYALVAMSGDAVKGVEFDVLADLEDANGTIPANMIIKDAGCSDWDAYTNKNATRLSYNFDLSAKADGYEGNTYILTANTAYNAEPAYKINPLGKSLSHMSGDFEKGKNYIISAWVKDVSAEGVAPIEFATAILDKNWNHMVNSKITLTDEWQQYAEIVTMPSNYPGLTYIEFGVPAENAFYAGQSFYLDEIYVAEEVPYEIKVTADANVVRAGDTITVDAEILNQLGKTGKLEQNVSWLAMNADRTAVIDNITITPSSTDSTVSTVSFAEDIEDGEYVIIAYSEETGLIKGMPVKVGGEFEATNVNIDINAGKVYFDLVGIPEAGATVNVYIAQYLGDALDIVEIEPVTVDGEKFAETGKEAPFTYKDGAEVKVFIWNEDQNALLETPTSKKKQ